MTEYEVEQSVNRLYFVQTRDEPRSERKNPNNKPDLDSEGVQTIIKRLTDKAPEKVSDPKRTQRDSMYKEMGVVNSFAWKGYN